jgi:hypothetical protein
MFWRVCPVSSTVAYNEIVPHYAALAARAAYAVHMDRNRLRRDWSDAAYAAYFRCAPDSAAKRLMLVQQ